MSQLFRPTQIALKLIKALVIFSTLVALITTSVQLWSEYDRDLDAIEFRFEQVERGYLESVAANVWHFDTSRLSLLVRGIIEFPDFTFAVVRGSDGKVLASAGKSMETRVIKNTYPLIYTYRDKQHEIGELEVVASLTNVYNRVIDRFGLILLSNAVKTFLVALFMFAVVHWLLTNPLNAIARHVQEIDFKGLKKPLSLKRKFQGRKFDEMDQLVDSLNHMQSRLFDELAARKQAEEKLLQAHDHLEERVEERTQSLTDEIANRKSTEEELRKVSGAVEQSTNMIFITDTNGTIEYVNARFTELSGYTPRDAIGAKPSILKSGDTPEEIYADLWQTILSGSEWRGELMDRCKNGDVFWAAVSIVPIHGEDGEITSFVAMHEDITGRKEAEQAMRDAHNAAEVANKAKTDLMANMSHELRTPLNAIIGFSETMKHSIFGPLGSPQYEEYADFIHSSGAHLLQLINDILDVSAVEAGKLTLREETVDVKELCEASVRIVAPKAIDSNIALSGIRGNALPSLHADPLRIKQIFINLLSNAVKFTPEKGEVSCDAYIDESKEMVITVTDTGVGMDEDGIEKAMSKFGQVDSSLSRSHEGTGLGLPLTKGLVELHGGTLELESKIGTGTKVTLRFPQNRLREQ